MSGNVLAIGISGLNAARAGLTTTGHNIANVSTDGYTRQSVVFRSALPQYTGSGYFGSGVEVSTVVRQYSTFLESQRLAAETQQGYLDAFQTQAQQIDNVLADPASGLSPALQDFFTGVQDVAANPSSVPSRQSMLSLSEALTSRFNTLDARFEELRKGVNVQIESSVQRINSLAKQIATINQQIASSPGTQETPPNDLLDQRDALVTQLNTIVRVQTSTQSDGSINVLIGSGQSLVVGSEALSLSAGPSHDDPANVSITMPTPAGESELPASLFTGGQLGGLLTFRDHTLDTAQNEFGRVALTLADSFNAQHRLGQDLHGALGQDYFVVPTAQVQARNTNAGDGSISATISDVGALTTSDYRVVYQGGNYTVRRLSDGTESTFSSLPQTLDGITMDLASGTPQDGDSFLIQPTRYAARDIAVGISDTALIAAAAPVRTVAGADNTGNAKMTQGVVTDVSGLPLPSDITFTYDQAANEWVVGGASPAVGPFAYTSGQDISFNGMSFTISGTPADGDVFTVTNNTGGVADNRNALLLAGLQTANTVANGTATYQGAYSQMVSDVGNQTREIQVQSQAQDALVKQTQQAQQSFSGVNLDEEAANLVYYQQAYQASGKVLQIASQLFDLILQLKQ
ncbi:MAG: flagellar hook-associated protein FlgK [Betaproteobacteria bacterium]|nr:flagellar hook-associated protein FlgK [Betaproteobacteria bacterium]